MNYKTIAAIGLVILLSGCAKNPVHSDGTQAFAFNKAAIVSSKEITSHFFFANVDFGMNDTIDLAAVCGGIENVVRVESRIGFWDSMYNYFTLTMYSPRTVTVYCAK